MKKRIFYSITGVSLISIFILNILIMFFMYNSFFEVEKEELRSEVEHMVSYIQEYGMDFDMLNGVTSHRTTIVNDVGLVIFENETDKESMENHLDRPEIQGAFEGNASEATRTSDTMGEQTYYYAMKVDSQHVLRMSVTFDSIFVIVLDSLSFLCLVSIFFVIITIVISNFLTKAIVKPLNVSDVSENIYSELLPFVTKIRKQEAYISRQKEKFEKITNDFNVITENIADGLILLNENSNIISINKKAQNILCGDDRDYSLKNILEVSRNLNLKEAVSDTLYGESSQIELQKNNKIYLLHVSPVFNGTVVSGTVILIVDNTKHASIEQIRREFSANVSHELKTPLTTISGYAELMMSGLVAPEHIKPFSENIFKEARHLVDLIEDIIKISRLDENREDSEFSKISVDETLEKIVDRLQNYADKHKVNVHKSITRANIMGIQHIIDEIFYNIIQNSIKYNQEGGEVFINISNTAKFTVISVRDTGIGISEESLGRIFERFYRDDKSHSKEISGSGLGLSIVKHGVNLHNGKVEVSSQLGQGTEFKIFLPTI